MSKGDITLSYNVQLLQSVWMLGVLDVSNQVCVTNKSPQFIFTKTSVFLPNISVIRGSHCSPEEAEGWYTTGLGLLRPAAMNPGFEIELVKVVKAAYFL